jgi:hypothetical protein
MGQALEVEPAMSLATILQDSASGNAERVALRLGDAATTYREVDGDRPPEAVTTEVLTRLSERFPLGGNP